MPPSTVPNSDGAEYGSPPAAEDVLAASERPGITDESVALAVTGFTQALAGEGPDAQEILNTLSREDQLGVVTSFIISTNKDIRVSMERLRAAVKHVQDNRLWAPLYASLEEWLADIDYDSQVGIIADRYCRAQSISSKGRLALRTVVRSWGCIPNESPQLRQIMPPHCSEKLYSSLARLARLTRNKDKTVIESLNKQVQQRLKRIGGVRSLGPHLVVSDIQRVLAQYESRQSSATVHEEEDNDGGTPAASVASSTPVVRRRTRGFVPINTGVARRIPGRKSIEFVHGAAQDKCGPAPVTKSPATIVIASDEEEEEEFWPASCETPDAAEEMDETSLLHPGQMLAAARKRQVPEMAIQEYVRGVAKAQRRLMSLAAAAGQQSEAEST